MHTSATAAVSQRRSLAANEKERERERERAMPCEGDDDVAVKRGKESNGRQPAASSLCGRATALPGHIFWGDALLLRCAANSAEQGPPINLLTASCRGKIAKKNHRMQQNSVEAPFSRARTPGAVICSRRDSPTYPTSYPTH